MESAKGSTANMDLSTKLDLTPLQTLLDTSVPILSPLKSGLLQKKVKYGNNVGVNKEDSEEEEEEERGEKLRPPVWLHPIFL